MEAVLQDAFGKDKKIADDGVLHTSLLVTAYQVRHATLYCALLMPPRLPQNPQCL